MVIVLLFCGRIRPKNVVVEYNVIDNGARCVVCGVRCVLCLGFASEDDGGAGSGECSVRE